jgi:hypothetical protein
VNGVGAMEASLPLPFPGLVENGVGAMEASLPLPFPGLVENGVADRALDAPLALPFASLGEDDGVRAQAITIGLITDRVDERGRSERGRGEQRCRDRRDLDAARWPPGVTFVIHWC